jgi:hypothetical protein
VGRSRPRVIEGQRGDAARVVRGVPTRIRSSARTGGALPSARSGVRFTLYAAAVRAPRLRRLPRHVRRGGARRPDAHPVFGSHWRRAALSAAGYVSRCTRPRCGHRGSSGYPRHVRRGGARRPDAHPVFGSHWRRAALSAQRGTFHAVRGRGVGTAAPAVTASRQTRWCAASRRAEDGRLAPAWEAASRRTSGLRPTPTDAVRNVKERVGV